MSYEYSDFGETLEHGTSSLENEICYTGGIYDDTTTLYYLNARYYEPVTGRFLTEDTYRGEIESVEDWHLYVYCKNNPINYVDPSGHSALTIATRGIAMIFGSVSVGAIAPVAAIAVGAFLAIKGYQKWGTKTKQKVNNTIFKTAYGTVVASAYSADYIKGLSISVAKAKNAKKSGKDEKHHIVPQTASSTTKAKKALSDTGIAMNSKINTVMLDYRLHRRLHRKTYYTYIEKYVPKKPYSKSTITSRLNKIRRTLVAANNAVKVVQ